MIRLKQYYEERQALVGLLGEVVGAEVPANVAAVEVHVKVNEPVGRVCRATALSRQRERARIESQTRQASCRRDSTLPLCGSFGSEDPQCGSGDEVALQIEGIVDGGVHAEETLGRSSGLEALLLALSSSHGLMRILCPIILPEPLLMRTGQSETPERRGVGAQLVGPAISARSPAS
jgi:hypothetical protein